MAQVMANYHGEQSYSFRFRVLGYFGYTDALLTPPPPKNFLFNIHSGDWSSNRSSTVLVIPT